VPFLPEDEALLANFCNRTKTWHLVREEVLAKFTRQDGKLFAPWVTAEMARPSEH
jgi:hypothetical protein